MYYLYLDESDKTGIYFSNFFGGSLIASQDLEEFISRISSIVKRCNLQNEMIIGRWSTDIGDLNHTTQLKIKT